MVKIEYPDLTSMLKDDVKESISKLKPQYRTNYTKSGTKSGTKKSPKPIDDEEKKKNMNDKERADYETKARIKFQKQKAKEKREVLKEMRLLSVEESLEIINERETNLVCIDTEFFERQLYKITEIGVSIYNPNYQKTSLFPHILNMHFIPREHLHLNNYARVPNNKLHNITGESKIISLENIPGIFQQIFEKLGPNTVLVGHDVIDELIMLQSKKVKIPSSIKIIDTQNIWLSLVGAEVNNVRSGLGYVLDKLSIPHAFLHNGVNDSYYTLIACLQMCSPGFRNNLRSRDDLLDFGINDNFTKIVKVQVNKKVKKDTLSSGDKKQNETATINKILHRMPDLKFNIPDDKISEKNTKSKGTKQSPVEENHFFTPGTFTRNGFETLLDDLMDFPTH